MNDGYFLKVEVVFYYDMLYSMIFILYVSYFIERFMW